MININMSILKLLMACSSKFLTCSRILTKSCNIVEGTTRHGQVQYKSTKSIKHHLDYTKVPKLNENDLEEHFMRGSGPGGQSVAKTNNAVFLKHKPTGITVKCHESRSLLTNKQRAREVLITKLDNMLNGEDSIEMQLKRLKKKELLDKTRKRNKMVVLKKSFREREGLE